jgi:hypothetical protein
LGVRAQVSAHACCQGGDGQIDFVAMESGFHAAKLLKNE